MGVLGDLFPDREKQSYVDRRLTPGRVLYLFCRFTDPPKDKYLLLLSSGVTPRSLLFLINSRIHPYIQRHPDLLNCQVLLGASDYSFLSHDSFIDCSRVIDHFDCSAIRDQLVNDIGRIKGELHRDTRREIIQVVQVARTVSPHHKRLIVQSLKEVA